jgi:uncharacterized protein YbcI
VPDRETLDFRPASHGNRLAELSNAMVQIYKEKFGRGPTKAQTVFATPDVVVCTLRSSMTVAEKRLAEEGEHLRLQETRLFFQRAFQAEFVGSVERITGRAVEGFVSGMDSDQDIATEIFYLESRPDLDG